MSDKSRGFTLMELVAVIIILGIPSAITLPAAMGSATAMENGNGNNGNGNGNGNGARSVN